MASASSALNSSSVPRILAASMQCGNRSFIAGMCERFEGEKGIPGFFDEGVIVGRCTECSRKRAFVFTD